MVEDEDEGLVTVEEAMAQIEARDQAERRERALLGMPEDVSRRFEDDGTLDEMIARKIAEQDRARREELEEMRLAAAERLRRLDEEYERRKADGERLAKRKIEHRVNRVYRCSACGSPDHRLTHCPHAMKSPTLSPDEFLEIKRRLDPKLMLLDGGHVVWTGRSPVTTVAGRQTSVRRVVWAMRQGYWPAGYLKQGCGVTNCIAHLRTNKSVRHRVPIVEGGVTSALQDAAGAVQDAASAAETTPAGTPLPVAPLKRRMGHFRPIPTREIERLRFRLEKQSVEVEDHRLWSGDVAGGVPFTNHAGMRVPVYVLAMALENDGLWPLHEVVNTCGIPSCFAHIEEQVPLDKRPKRPSARRRR